MEDIGFIMFECGLEGTCVKITKHSHFDKVDPNDDKMTCKTDSDICYADSLRSEEYKPEKPPKIVRSSVIDEIFKKKDSTSSKPSTPNLGTCHPEPVPETEPVPLDPTANNLIVPVKDTEKASSCVIDLKTVWFNFAAPPRTPITKKIDYTR